MTLTKLTQAEVDAATTKTSLETELATLKAECEALDVAAVRPLRAVAAGTATDSDKTYLVSNESLVSTKRSRISVISGLLLNYVTTS